MKQPVPGARAETANGASGVGVTARALTRRFGNHLALDRVDLQIAPRARFSLLGANGAGKTTFIRMLTGFLLPNSGALTVEPTLRLPSGAKGACEGTLSFELGLRLRARGDAPGWVQ